MRINDAFSSLRSIFLEWDGFLINNRFTKDKSEITWFNYKQNNFINTITRSHVVTLIENFQYSFQVRDDGSIFQIHYVYDRTGRNIITANLGFIYSGLVLDEGGDILYSPNDDEPVGWIRIDYSANPKDDGGVIHSKCHMHLCTLPSTRIIVDRIPNPKQFVEFILATCYPNYYKRFRLDDKGLFSDIAKMCQLNDPSTPDIVMDPICEYATHLKMPKRTATPVVSPGSGRQTRRSPH